MIRSDRRLTRRRVTRRLSMQIHTGHNTARFSSSSSIRLSHRAVSSHFFSSRPSFCRSLLPSRTKKLDRFHRGPGGPSHCRRPAFSEEQEIPPLINKLIAASSLSHARARVCEYLLTGLSITVGGFSPRLPALSGRFRAFERFAYMCIYRAIRAQGANELCRARGAREQVRGKFRGRHYCQLQ